MTAHAAQGSPSKSRGWHSADLPGVCCRCNLVYLAGQMVRPDLGGLRAWCCAIQERAAP